MQPERHATWPPSAIRIGGRGSPESSFWQNRGQIVQLSELWLVLHRRSPHLTLTAPRNCMNFEGNAGAE